MKKEISLASTIGKYDNASDDKLQTSEQYIFTEIQLEI